MQAHHSKRLHELEAWQQACKEDASLDAVLHRGALADRLAQIKPVKTNRAVIAALRHIFARAIVPAYNAWREYYAWVLKMKNLMHGAIERMIHRELSKVPQSTEFSHSE